MKYDDILTNYVGEFGRFQQVQYVLVCLPVVMLSMQSLSWTFAAADLDHRCAYPNEMGNYSAKYIYQHLNISISQNKELYDKYQCSRPVNTSIHQISQNTSSLPFEGCLDGYVYDNSDITNSAINRWEISCDQYFIKALIQSLYYFGQAIGSIAFGIISDKTGRKKSFLIAIGFQCAAGIGMALSPWWWMFGIFRAVVGFFHPGIYIMTVVIGIEFVGPSKRFLGTIMPEFAYILGQVTMATIAFGIRDYRYLMLAISLPSILFISYAWLVPESARWLLAQGRVDEANQILMNMAKWNGREIPEAVLKQVNFDEQAAPQVKSNYTFADLFRYPGLRKRTFISYYCWIAVTGVYYGISMNPNIYGGDRYITFILTALAGIPGVLCTVFVNKLGRKLLLMIGFSLTAFFMFLTLAFDNSNTVILTACVILAKACIAMSYAVIYMFTPELYPTGLRNTATGSCSMMARVGSFSASYVAMYLVKYSRTAVVLIFGFFSLSAAIAVIFQPETSGLPLAETIQEAEDIGRFGNIMSFKMQHRPSVLQSDEEKSASEQLTGPN